MDTLSRLRVGLVLGCVTLVLGGPSLATAPVATSAAATAPAATAPKKPSVDKLLAERPAAPLHLANTPIPEALKIVGKTFDLDVVNNYELPGVVYINLESISARQAIDSLNATIGDIGYTIVESARGEPPRVVLIVVPTRVDAGAFRPVYQGNDPENIPDGPDIRTQIMTFSNVDPDKLRTFLAAVIDKNATLTINPATKTITLTDTSTHVRAAAKLLELLESQGTENK